MMNDLLMLEAALFQLRAVPIDDPQFRLGITMLGNAVDAARARVNAARVSDIDFALGDLGNAVDYLDAADAEQVGPILEMIREDVWRLRESTALPKEVFDRITALQQKLKARRTAIERQTYQEGGSEQSLPHAPETLIADVQWIREELQKGGFATPALDAFLDEPNELRFHSIGAMLDELEVVG